MLLEPYKTYGYQKKRGWGVCIFQAALVLAFVWTAFFLIESVG